MKRQDQVVIWCLAASLLAGSVLQAQQFPPLPGFPGAQPAQAPPQPAPQPAAQPAPQPPAQAPPAAAAQTAPQATPAQPAPVRIGNLSLQNASLTEVIDQLARQLHINYILDPAVKGSIVLNTYGDTANLDARNLLDLILRINGAGMVQEGDIYRIVPLKAVPKLPIRPENNPKVIQEDDQTMLNMIFLKYVTVDELTKILGEFVGENATMYSYAPANLLFILDSRRNMRRIMDLVSMFDSDTFANQRVRLFEVTNTRPSDVQKDLENVLKAVSLDGKNVTVRFLPVDRINTLIAVAPNPGVFDTIAEWLRKLDVPVRVSAGAVETHVYHVRYGRSECLSIALNQLFGTQGQGYGGYPGGGYPGGSYGGGGYPQQYGSMGGGLGPGTYGSGGGGGLAGFNGSATPGGYGNANSFSGGFGGSGSCGASMGGSGGYGGGYGGGYPNGGGYGYPVFGGYAAQQPASAVGQPAGAIAANTVIPGAPAAAAAAAAPAQPLPPPVRIVPNPLDNALIIQADAQVLQAILKILKDLDVPPRQILLEAKIYSVDLTGTFASGVAASLQPADSANKSLLGSLSSAGTNLSAGALVGKSRELLATLSLSENVSRAHVLSEPSLIATDSIPATLNVGTQIPVTTGTTTIPTGGGTTVQQSISSENTGVTLQVQARVNPSGVVTLIINQQVSTPSAGAGTLTPSFNQQVVQTQITVQDGDTIAIGGLIGETTTDSISGIPLLDRIPYIGALFGTKNYSHERTELIIFMTPHVIYDESGLIEASNELKQRVKKLQKYVKEL